MSKPANQEATYEDLYSLPENVVGEILGGELFAHPRPAPRHSLAASMIGAELIRGFGSRGTGGNGNWWILDEPECHLGKDVVVPDLAGWRKNTLTKIPDTAWIDIRPDWVCEVISPSTAQYDRGIKREIYAREEVGHYWIVDPVEKIIEVFALKDGFWLLAATATNDQQIALVPFETMPFDLSSLWV